MLIIFVKGFAIGAVSAVASVDDGEAGFAYRHVAFACFADVIAWDLFVAFAVAFAVPGILFMQVGSPGVSRAVGSFDPDMSVAAGTVSCHNAGV